MRKSDAIAYFKTQTKLAAAARVTKSAVSQWGEWVPEAKAYRLQSLTRGKLKVVPSAYESSATDRVA